MSGILVQLIPIFIYFAIGLALRKLAVANTSQGEFMLRFVFYVTLPLLILTSLSRTPMTLDKAWLPLANISVNFACMLVALLVVKFLVLDRKTTGTMLVSTMIVNNTFMFPFILAVYGEQSFTDAVLFDFGNALLMATYVHALAFRYGGEDYSPWSRLIKIIKSPLIWALLLGVIMSITGIRLPQQVVDIVGPLGQMTGPLILVALGIFFSLSLADLKLVSLTVLIRMGMGLLFGIAIANYLDLGDSTFIVVVLCSGAPIGFNALTFSSLAKLDTQLSSSAVSVSVLAGLIYIPLLMLMFS